ncbi:hypothetical protein CANCADRAFT_45523 [Tortispora caseinolytica NRRL Y-17796]|uniref:Protoporphyrinogen oxidase n=1 Tax=Tortispora caseinolytica NRRL Y-17796 TaxID=767744 RepID=A0A1E4TBA4_9ASCO|nr:hypothetical protein CANCADRAFT_45523 [Tortispora caseinolytica NRRL Y-17796]
MNQLREYRNTANTIKILLRRPFSASGCNNKRVAIVGAGWSGLTSAYFLHRCPELAAQLGPEFEMDAEDVHVTIFEKDSNVGGRIATTTYQSDETGVDINIESAARTLKTGRIGLYSYLEYDLLKQTGIMNTGLSSIGLGREPPPMRFVYYNNRLWPAHIFTMMIPGNPILKTLIEILKNIGMSKENMDFLSSRPDFSIKEFVTHMLPEGGSALCSALCNGIYGTSWENVSVRTAMPSLYNCAIEYASIYEFSGSRWKAVMAAREAMLRSFASLPLPFKLVSPQSAKFWFNFSRSKLENEAKDVEFLTYAATGYVAFKRGMQSFHEDLASFLLEHTSTNIKTNTSVTKILKTEDEMSVEYVTADGSPRSEVYDHVICASPFENLRRMVDIEEPIPNLHTFSSTKLDVVSMYFPERISFPNAFGYLYSRYKTTNSNGLLGVAFDSDVNPYTVCENGEPSDKGRLITAMRENDGMSTESQILEETCRTLSDHLMQKIDPEIAVVQTKEIPTPMPGHLMELQGLNEWLMLNFQGKLSVVGASYLNIGMSRCIEQSFLTAYEVLQHRSTGLSLAYQI